MSIQRILWTRNFVMNCRAVPLTQCLGVDHAHQNIRVNAVCPNDVNTPMIRSVFETRGLDPDKAIDALNASVPLGRIAEPKDIADIVVFLHPDSLVSGTHIGTLFDSSIVILGRFTNVANIV